MEGKMLEPGEARTCLERRHERTNEGREDSPPPRRTGCGSPTLSPRPVVAKKKDDVKRVLKKKSAFLQKKKLVAF
jgi:hypothetical protein